jgi:hypothetical protein
MADRVQNLIQGSQNDFFAAFRNKMHVIMQEMTELRKKADIERIRAKQREKATIVQKERDWFKKEALDLNK